jgi:hypothetical protein
MKAFVAMSTPFGLLLPIEFGFHSFEHNIEKTSIGLSTPFAQLQIALLQTTPLNFEGSRFNMLFQEKSGAYACLLKTITKQEHPFVRLLKAIL